MSDLFLMWAICFWCEPCFWYERFVFVVSDLFLMWAICFWCERFVFDVSDLFLVWAICFWCEGFVFDVSDLFLICTTCFWRDPFIFDWQLLATLVSSFHASSLTPHQSLGRGCLIVCKKYKDYVPLKFQNDFDFSSILRRLNSFNGLFLTIKIFLISCHDF